MARASRRLMLAALAALPLAACDRGGSVPPPFKAIDITGAEYARELKLPDADGRPRTLADWKGKVVVVFFGYTQCPDVCPTTMAEVAQAKKLLGPAGADVQAVFVTVDPERDTPEVLKAYVANFGSDFVALRGSDEETRATAKQFKVMYAKQPGQTASSYTVDHSAASYVFDRLGRVRLYARYGSGAEALAKDLERLLAEPSA